jgi:OPT family oligopeptide transporter
VSLLLFILQFCFLTTYLSESPYPEVQAAVSSVDDPSMPVNTFRMWFLGILFTLLISGLNQVFSMRCMSAIISPSSKDYIIYISLDSALYVSIIVVQVVSLPLGRGLAAILPTKHFNTFGYIWSLNPGPFSIKEHVCIAIMANAGAMGAYSTEVVLTQCVFYGQTTPMSFQILLAIGSQTLCFCFGGLLRQFVVWPSSMIWPAVVANCAFYNSLHKITSTAKTT